MSDQLAPTEPALTGGGASTPPGGRGGLRAFLSDVNRRRTWYADALTTLIAIILAFLVGAVLMIISDPAVISQYAYLFTAPELPLGASWEKVSGAYSALVAGSIGGLRPLAETTAQAAPLICAGLGVALAFRAGLFNIGAQGQAVVGAIVAAWVGFSITGIWYLALLLAIIGGFLAGALWGGIAGFLKARFGAHEVIVTIMLNYIASGLLAWLLTTTAFQRPGRTDPISPIIDWFATMPRIEGTRLHLGFFLAVLAAVGMWWLLDRSTLGFSIRAVGANPHAAATAGISVARTTVLTMMIAGGLGGLAGAQAALAPGAGGTAVPLSAGLVGTVGFDAITVALLGRSKPGGVVFAGLLFGALKAGGLSMQSVAQTPLTLTVVLQALIVLFVAAPALVRTVAPFITLLLRPAGRRGAPA
ncbi:ABC transporter permease [Naumannella halotolerans]|uniref:Simple sugar transport system permease protein n=1 Tax=Naumannella halotolerans TaxID=993414 RepID=A0A4R7JC18_9ACTN|nr:ABC transporter permease [Naumannella halotolerans]TDT34173.1 simple sugar transport system permease protein [Naumannella halotolerans]